MCLVKILFQVETWWLWSAASCWQTMVLTGDAFLLFRSSVLGLFHVLSSPPPPSYPASVFSSNPTQVLFFSKPFTNNLFSDVFCAYFSIEGNQVILLFKWAFSELKGTYFKYQVVKKCPNNSLTNKNPDSSGHSWNSAPPPAKYYD